MKSIVFSIVSLTFLSCIYTFSEICRQSDETCKHYEQCPLDLQAKVAINPKPLTLLAELKKARCGKGRKLCCKSLPPPPTQPECYTWDGRPGVCLPSKQANTRSMTFRQLRFSRCTKRGKFLCVSDLPVTQNPECNPTAFPPDPATGCCGKDKNTENKIIGGTGTALDQFPWLAVLKYEEDKKNCTGALISGRYVLTAAHCVHHALQHIPYAVVLGEHNKASQNDCDETGECRENVELTIGIEEIIMHEGFNPTNPVVKDDIALIRLIKMATYSDYVQPICLPILSSDVTRNPPPNFKFWSAGWGDVNASFASPSDIKRKVQLPYVNPYECVNSYPPLNSLQLCAGGEAGKDSCTGDSGSPLMYDRDLTYEVLGITSHGIASCGTDNMPAIYTKVYPYNSWIHSHIRS